jgi:peptide/nickel transport system substrate-binding protein
MFYFEDVALNTDLSPSPSSRMLVDGVPGVPAKIDDYTFQMTFHKPFGVFIENLARWRPNNYLPKHYLQQFHPTYTKMEDIEATMKAEGYDTWVNLFNSKMGGHLDAWGMPDRPVLLAWIPQNSVTEPVQVMERNPYYFMIDTAGNQLPYIDRMHSVLVADKNVGDLKLIAGELDMDGIFETIADYPLFAENQEAGGYELLLPRHPSNQILLYLVNMGHADPEIRKILGDQRFRAALSHALDRNQIKETIMRGTGRVAQFATDRGGPYYEEGMEEAYAAYDPEKAKQLLDDLGMVDADGDGWRDRLDGEPFLFIFEYPQVQAPLAGADFAKRYWEAIGIRVDVKETSGGAYAKVRNAYENMVTMWHAAGTVTPIDPWFLGGAVANVSWNHWYNTNGEKGIEPPQWYVTLRDSQKAYLAAVDEADATAAAKTAWRMQSEHLPVIGTVTGVGHPFVFSKKLGNIARAEALDWDSNGILDYSDQYFFKE